jgi:hypothetical protein
MEEDELPDPPFENIIMLMPEWIIVLWGLLCVGLQPLASLCGQAIALVFAVGLVWQGHFNQAAFQSRQ